MTTGQEIRAALNAAIESQGAEASTLIDAERVDALCEFRITVNRILHEAGELAS